MRLFFPFLTVLIFIVGAFPPLQAKRIALVIGNAVYAADRRLKKENDALSVFLRSWMSNQASNSAFAWASDFAPFPKYCYWNNPGGAPLIRLRAQNFTLRRLKNNKSNNANDWVSDFAPSVDYCDKKSGPATHRDLLKGRREPIRKFPNRSYSIVDFKIISPTNPETRAHLVYSYDYGRAKGKSSLSLTLKTINRKFKITRFDEKVAK